MGRVIEKPSTHNLKENWQCCESRRRANHFRNIQLNSSVFLPKLTDEPDQKQQQPGPRDVGSYSNTDKQCSALSTEEIAPIKKKRTLSTLVLATHLTILVYFYSRPQKTFKQGLSQIRSGFTLMGLATHLCLGQN